MKYAKEKCDGFYANADRNLFDVMADAGCVLATTHTHITTLAYSFKFVLKSVSAAVAPATTNVAVMLCTVKSCGARYMPLATCRMPHKAG